MRAKEFVIERKMPERKSSVMNTTFYFPTMPSANPYEVYRFGMALANPEMPHSEGPASNAAVITTYTSEEEQIINAAIRKTGHKSKILADKGSKEPKSTDTASPVAKIKKNKYGI